MAAGRRWHLSSRAEPLAALRGPGGREVPGAQTAGRTLPAHRPEVTDLQAEQNDRSFGFGDVASACIFQSGSAAREIIGVYGCWDNEALGVGLQGREAAARTSSSPVPSAACSAVAPEPLS